MSYANKILAAFALIAATPANAALNAAECAALEGAAVAPADIGLPSGPATIVAASLQTSGTASFCALRGVIQPVDQKAPLIIYQINLPSAWNGKAVQYGGGGFNGVLISGLDPLRDAPLGAPTPVQQGYATWGTDSGHQNAGLAEIQAFALNDEALANFAYASYKKTRDVAVKIAARAYGSPPRKIYYFGGSEGGREGLMAAQRFPADYDGVVSTVPVINWVGLQIVGNRSGIAQQNGGWLNPAKVALLRKATQAACDAADGLADGIVSRYEKCVGTFDPRSLRCANGADAGDACLSDAQIKAVEAYHTRYEYPFPLANGVTSYPGYNYGSEDQPDGMVNWASGPSAPASPPPSPATQARIWYYGNGAVRYFFARDPKFDSLKFDPVAFRDNVSRISEMMDSTNPDLSQFLARGGKLILKENASDHAQSPFAGVDYYKSVVAKMGQDKVDGFMRFFVTPGASHSGFGVNGIDGAPIPRGVDLLGVLDDWASAGKAPDALSQIAQNPAAPFATLSARPLCRYPLYPRYDGAGDVKLPASFACAPQ